MRSGERRRGWPVLLVPAIVAAACGGGSATEGGGSTPPALHVCTGPPPANASACPGAEAGLASDAPRVVASSCACSAPCTPTPCAYLCNLGYLLGPSGACERMPIDPPATRFVDNGDGTVTVTDAYDQVTWLRDAACSEAVGGVARGAGPLSWYQAMDWSLGLADGACGLRDGSRPGAWRLPTQTQLMHLQIDLAQAHTFTNVQPGVYWSSWTYWADKAGAVDLYTGQYFEDPKTSLRQVWPVR